MTSPFHTAYSILNFCILMRIAIIGTGYVGLVSGACFAEMGASVTCLDKDAHKINQLRNGIIPLYEPGLTAMVTRNLSQGRLAFESKPEQVLNNADIFFIAVGTPSQPDGQADLSSIEAVARQIGQNLQHDTVIVVKSTVPPGTCHRLKKIIEEEIRLRAGDASFELAFNPEFLKEGSAIKDFMSPDRIIIGADTSKAVRILQKLYAPFMLKNDRLLVMDTVSAEISKYVSNSMLAARISLMNEISRLCEAVGADICRVREGVGSDTRIGNSFLYAGCGYGGSCFPKDIRALIRTANEHGVTMDILEAVEQCNQQQKRFLIGKVKKAVAQTSRDQSSTVALWGLSFKPETDDIREAPAMALIEELLKDGIRLRVYDPAAMDSTRQRWGEALYYADDMYDAASGADVLVLTTEWKEFRLPDWKNVYRSMASRHIVDGRNIYCRSDLEAWGFTYQGIGCSSTVDLP